MADDRLVFYRQIIPWLEPGAKTLLEIGCASGYGLSMLRYYRPQYMLTGYDFSAIAIMNARRFCRGADFKLFDVTTQAPEEAFDYILLIETVEHIREPFNVIKKCLKKCKYLIITVPHVIMGRPSAPTHLCDDFKVKDFRQYRVLLQKQFLRNRYLAVMLEGKL